MRRFLYGSVSVLILAVAFHLGATRASTSYVDHTCRGIIAHSHDRSAGVALLDEDGAVWRVSANQGWELQTDIPALPVGVAEVKFMAASGQEVSLVTASNQVWLWDGHGGWSNCGVWPGDTVVERTSWGGIKASYREAPAN